MRTHIQLTNFRIHKSTNINIVDTFSALVGKNDIGKSSVLEALDILCNGEKNISEDDITKGSTVPANITYTTDNGVSLDYSSPTIEDDRRAANISFYKFGVDDNNHFIDLNQDLNSLINSCHQFVETIYPYHFDEQKVEDLLNIFINLGKLYSVTQSQPIKDFISEYMSGNRDLQKIIANKWRLNSLCTNSDEKNILDTLFGILSQFEPNIQKVVKCEELTKKAKQVIRQFKKTGDSNLIFNINEITLEEFQRNDETIRNIKQQPAVIYWIPEESVDPDPNVDWENFKNLIKKTFLNGNSQINNIPFFRRTENRDYVTLIMEGSLDEIAAKSNEILERVDQESKKDIAYLWEQYLNSFGSRDVKLAKRGSGFKRLCEIYYFTMSKLSESSNNGGPIILAVEEPEISLHPSQQRDIVNRLQDILNLPNTQVIISTHSPYIVNELDEKSVCILKRETQTDAQGNTIEVVSTSAMNKRIIKYPSMAEVNYLAFDEPSMTYHQELFCHIEIEWSGKSNGDSIGGILSKMYKIQSFKDRIKELLQNYYMLLPDLDSFTSTDPDYYQNLLLKHQFYREDKQETVGDYCICRCVRDSIDHTSTKNYKWKDDKIVELSLKILVIVAEYFAKAKEMLKNYSSTDADSQLDIGENKHFTIDGDANNHTQNYCCWYFLNHPDAIIKQRGIEYHIKPKDIICIVKRQL